MFPREVDQEFLYLPPTEKDVQKGWKKLAPNGVKNGRTFYAFQCLHCHKCFANHKNAHQHLDHCPVLHPSDKHQLTITAYIIKNEGGIKSYTKQFKAIL